jgi:hypothetical protein
MRADAPEGANRYATSPHLKARRIDFRRFQHRPRRGLPFADRLAQTWFVSKQKLRMS